MYIIIELQTNDQGEVGSIVTTRATRREADADYHGKLAYAALSEVPVHAVVMLTERGEALRSESYTHGAAEAAE